MLYEYTLIFLSFLSFFNVVVVFLSHTTIKSYFNTSFQLSVQIGVQSPVTPGKS